MTAPQAIASQSDANATRKRLISAVHATASRIGIADEDRRSLQLDLTGKASLAQMNLAEIGKVLDAINKGRSSARAPKSPQQAKIRALWLSVYYLGAVAHKSDAALNAFISNRFGVSSLRFVDHIAGPKIIEGLKDMAIRAGVIWPKAHEQRTFITKIVLLERHAVLAAIWARLVELGEVTATPTAYSDYLTQADNVIAPFYSKWSERELDEAIALLGEKLRTALSAAGQAG